MNHNHESQQSQHANEIVQITILISESKQRNLFKLEISRYYLEKLRNCSELQSMNGLKTSGEYKLYTN